MSVNHAQIQRTNYFSGGEKLSEERLAEPAQTGTPCSCPGCSCPACASCMVLSRCTCNCTKWWEYMPSSGFGERTKVWIEASFHNPSKINNNTVGSRVAWIDTTITQVKNEAAVTG